MATIAKSEMLKLIAICLKDSSPISKKLDNSCLCIVNVCIQQFNEHHLDFFFSGSEDTLGGSNRRCSFSARAESSIVISESESLI